MIHLGGMTTLFVAMSESCRFPTATNNIAMPPCTGLLRQPDGERRTLTERALDGNRSIHLRHDVTADAQSQTVPACFAVGGGFGGEERLKDLFQVLG